MELWYTIGEGNCVLCLKMKDVAIQLNLSVIKVRELELHLPANMQYVVHVECLEY